MIERSQDGHRARPRTWTLDRVAWFCFLVGQGHSAKAIAADPLIKTTPANVYRQAYRCGISLAEAPSTEIRIRLPIAIRAAIDRRAADDGMLAPLYLRRIVIDHVRALAG